MKPSILFDSSPDTALLIRDSALLEDKLTQFYTSKLENRKVVACPLYMGKGKKPNKRDKEACLDDLLPELRDMGVTSLVVADAEYFKTIAKVTKTDASLGYALNCKYRDYTFKVFYCPNYQGILYNPAVQDKINLTLQALNQSEALFSEDFIHNAVYYNHGEEGDIEEALQELLEYPELTCDIEAFSLNHYEAGIATITFCVDEHNGLAFPVDYQPLKVLTDPNLFGEFVVNQKKRKLLKTFFENYRGKLIFHNCTYDTKVLIYTLWMEHLNDQKGLLEGLHILHKNIEDTKIISYLCLNSCADISLSLKDLAHEYTGNYAQDSEDIKDVRRIPLDDLLKYNLIDGLATWYVYKKYQPSLVLEELDSIYDTLMIPSLKVITQMELTGACLDMPRVIEVETELQKLEELYLTTLYKLPFIGKFTKELQQDALDKDYNNRKAKAVHPDKIKPKLLDSFKSIIFNPGSSVQLSKLLYDFLGLPVIDTTATKAPATGSDTLKKLLSHTTSDEIKKLLNTLRDLSKVQKILSTFIPAFKKAPKGIDGNHYLFGSFILGGTLSGRLSSRNPNLQNLPSGSTYGKLIKSCFIAPDGMLFGSSDFDALEDVINTLLTKDPNKEKVLVKGYDGHSFRTRYYWPSKFGHIDTDDVKAVNSIKETHDSDRSASKPVSFALQYLGTWATLVNNCGFTPDEAKSIEANFHELYKVSRQWVESKIKEASKVGYARGAFGLKIRTPILAKVLYGTSTMPKEAQKEARSLGNAISGQSYGLLNCRAANEFMQRVWNSPYALRIRMCLQIHDALYLYFDNDIEVIKWVNDNLIECMAWNELPEIQHPIIKLSSAMDIHYPNWSKAINIPNKASEEDIIRICEEAN